MTNETPGLRVGRVSNSLLEQSSGESGSGAGMMMCFVHPELDLFYFDPKNPGKKSSLKAPA